jgi:hypothetical protein
MTLNDLLRDTTAQPAQPPLPQRAMLVNLNLSQWTARKYDRKATKQVTQANGAAGAAGRFNKHLLPMSQELEEVSASFSALRAYVTNATLPWSVDGVRLLPSATYFEFLKGFKALEPRCVTAVERFLMVYDPNDYNLRQMLGSLYDPADYPSVDAVRSKFNIDLQVMPVPETDFRCWPSTGDFDNETVERLQREANEKINKAQATALCSLYDRLIDRVSYMAGKLNLPIGSDGSIFRDGFVHRVQSVAEQAKAMNFANDANLDTMASEVKLMLCRYSDEVLRSDALVRNNVAIEADRLLGLLTLEREKVSASQ